MPQMSALVRVGLLALSALIIGGNAAENVTVEGSTAASADGGNVTRTILLAGGDSVSIPLSDVEPPPAVSPPVAVPG